MSRTNSGESLYYRLFKVLEVNVVDVKRLVNAEGATDHTALLPTKKKELVDFDSLTENERKVLGRT